MATTSLERDLEQAQAASDAALAAWRADRGNEEKKKAKQEAEIAEEAAQDALDAAKGGVGASEGGAAVAADATPAAAVGGVLASAAAAAAATGGAAGGAAGSTTSAASGSLGAAAKISKAKEHKDAGNAFFKAGKFSKAKSEYGKVFAYIGGLHGPNSSMKQYNRGAEVSMEQEAEIAALGLSVNLNLALAFLKLEKPRKTLELCDKVLATDPENVKAIYRAGLAWMSIGDIDKAQAWLQNAAARSPDDKAIAKSLVQLERKAKKAEAISRAKEKKAFAGAFA